MSTKKPESPKSFIFSALSRYVIIQEFSISKKTPSGIDLPENSKLNSNVCMIMSMPQDTKLTVKPGDHVLVNPMSGFPITSEGVDYKAVSEMDILAVYNIKQLGVIGLNAVNYKERAGMNAE